MNTDTYPETAFRRENPPRQGANRSSPATVDAAVEFGRFRVLLRQRQLLADGVPVELGTRAFDLLLALLEADGLLVSKEDLVSRVWPDVVVSEENLKVQVSGVLCSSAAVGGCQRPSRAKQRSAPTLPTHASGDEGTRPQNRWQSFRCSFGWS
jgi:hypothetical protein